MSTYIRRRHSPEAQYNDAGKSHGNVYTQPRHGVVPGRREDGVDWPFPNKPVTHRRPLNAGNQDSLDLCVSEKLTITKQPRGPLSPKEHHSNDIRETTVSQHPRKDSHRLPRGELQMARAIRAKELMLQQKLWSVEEKIRQKIQRDTAACDDQRSEEERHHRREAERANTQTKREREQEDVKQLRNRQDQRNEDRRNTHEEERARWKQREIDLAKSQRRGHQNTVYEQEVSEKCNKSRENLKEHTRRKGEDEKDNGIWGESQDGTVKTKEREQNTNSTGDKSWTREKKYKERTCKEVYGFNNDMPQMNHQKTSHKAATENHRGAGQKRFGGPMLPPVSPPSHSSTTEQGELRQEDDRDLQFLPCRVCNRKFARQRLQKHVQICEKVKQSHRPVFNSYVNRTKGSALEEFWKTHSRSKTPEVLRKKANKANTRNPQEGRLPAGTSQQKCSKRANQK